MTGPPLSCFYLDEALNDDELGQVTHLLIGPWARFRTGAGGLQQKRVPFVVPAPDEQGNYSESREQRAARIAVNLQRAGIRHENGRRVVWVMPRATDWDAIFQYAIRRETGFAPFVVQRWFADPLGGAPVRGPIRLYDTQMLIEGLE